jgi:hypothetical protein
MPGRANVNDVRAVNNYKAVAGANWNWGDHTGVKQAGGRWANDADGLNRGNGIICRNELNNTANITTFGDIKDGTSNTLAVGEAVPAWCNHTWWYWFNGTTATCGVPLNYRKGNPTVKLEAQLTDWGRNYSFFSQHPGGAYFALADGSARFVADNIDINVYRAGATINGGESLQLP